MKKIYIIVTVVLVSFLFPICAFAAEFPASIPAGSPVELSDTNNPSSETPEMFSSIYFSLDNNNVYSNMEKAYKDGYMPVVKNGKAIVIFPLVANGEIKENSIKATPNLGDPATSPFFFKNYQKTISLQNNKVNGGEKFISSYYVRFDLDLSPKRINGTYPVTVDIQAEDKNGNQIAQTFTAYLTITDGVDPSSTADTPSDELADAKKKPTSQPIIIVSNHTVTPSTIVAGKEFEVDVTFLNTNESKFVQNMTVTATTENPSITLLNDSNTFYFKKLGKGSSLSLKLKYKAGLDIVPGKYNINLALSYDNSDATTLTSSGLISVEVIQPLRVQMSIPQISESVNAGDTLPLTFQVMNLGRSAVYNVRCEISGAGLLPNGTAFIGNMEPGTSSSTDLNVFIGTKDMSEGYVGSDKYGKTDGTIKLLYEDANGKEYFEEYPFTTTINEPVINTNAATNEEKAEAAGQWWISIAILGGVAVGVVVWFIIRKKKGMK